MVVLCVLYSKDKRQNAGQSGQRNMDKVQRDNKNKSCRGHEYLCCVLYRKDKGTSQDNEVKETSTGEVQRESKRMNSGKKKSRQVLYTTVSYYSVLFCKQNVGMRHVYRGRFYFTRVHSVCIGTAHLSGVFIYEIKVVLGCRFSAMSVTTTV